MSQATEGSRATEPMLPESSVRGQGRAGSLGRRIAPQQGLGLRALREYGIIFVVVALFLVLTFASPAFLTQTNLLAILEQNAPVGIVAVGMTLCFIGGGFDLSVGAVYVLAGIVSAKYVGALGPTVAILAGVAVGVVAGTINGLVTTKGRINPFVATLSSAIVVGGIGTVLVGSGIISTSDKTFLRLGSDSFLGAQWSVWIWLVFSLLCGFLLQRTTFGRYLYAIGGSEEAARLAGVRVSRMRLGTYIISGFAAGLAGTIVASRSGAAQPANGGELSLAVTAVAGVVIGGTSILGGEGAVWRTILGILLLALIANGFNLMNVNASYQAIFQGLLIMLAVGVDTWARGRTT